jgi:hypothetical protein
MQHKDLLPLMQFKPRKGAIATNTPLINSSLSNWNIWLLTQTCRCAFTQLCQCHLELEGPRRPSSFYLGHFFFSKSFNHITKDASVFHLKSSGSYRLSYFPTSTPSRRTSHHHKRYIASHWFLTYKYGRPTMSGRYGHGEIFIPTLSQLMSCHFSLFLNFTPLYISLIYSVLFNKALHDFPKMISIISPCWIGLVPRLN